MAVFPPPRPFRVWTDAEPTMWINDVLQPLGREEDAVLVGEIVPSGFEAYARIFHPGRRFFGNSIKQSVLLRWSEIASARGKTIHPEMQVEALIDDLDAHDYERWTAISTGGGEWLPPNEWLEDTEALALAAKPILHLPPFAQPVLSAAITPRRSNSSASRTARASSNSCLS